MQLKNELLCQYIFLHLFKPFLNLLALIWSVKRWFGKLFQSLTILTKKDYLKELTLANLVCILYGWLALVFLLLQNSK